MPYKDREKQKQAQHASYVRNMERVKEASKRSRSKRNSIINEMKEASPCMDCGVSYPHYIMDFDHTDGSTKIGAIAYLLDRASLDTILDEVAKCDLICSNCHRERTFRRAQTECSSAW